MDKFLDTSQASNYLKLPEWLEPNNTSHSPKTSPASSPKSQRHFVPKVKSPLIAECPLPDDNKKDVDYVNEGDSSFDKESNGDTSTEDESPDADEEESEEEQTPTLTRPSDLLDNRGEQNGVRLTKQGTLTAKDYDASSFTFTETEHDPKAAGIMAFDNDDEDEVQSTSPTSPNPNAVNIMQFDSDLEDDEDPLRPTPFCDGIGNTNNTVIPRRTQQLPTFKGTWSKVFKATKSRKPLPYNGVTRTKEQDVIASSSDGDEPGGDGNSKQKKSSKPSKLFGKKQTKS